MRRPPLSSSDDMLGFAAELFPICRSITGKGVRATLQRIGELIPLQVHEAPSGTPVLDWSIPDEWNIRGAWIADAQGRRIVDFANSNLHVVNYSAPVRARMSLEQLRPHLHTLSERPDWIPYKTSYYKRDWGFCLPHSQLSDFVSGEYEVCIDSSLEPGALSYGECFLPGSSAEEFLFSAHCCHPSLANDNLSGIVVAVAVAQRLAALPKRRLSYRFLFAPGTIGAIAWLAAHADAAKVIKHGLVLTCVGDGAPFTYKKSRRGDAAIDRAVASVLSEDPRNRILEFSPYGYDERQFCSPGFNLPVGCLMRSQYGTFPQYHTSADNLSFISGQKLTEAVEIVLRVVELIENEGPPPSSTMPARLTQRPRSARVFYNLKARGEPQLGKYGFYDAFGPDTMPGLWVLNLSDGTHSLDQIAQRAELPFDTVAKAADVLLTLGLVREVSA